MVNMKKLITKSFQTGKNCIVYPLVKIIDVTEISKKKVKEFEGYKFYLTTGNLDNSKILVLNKITYRDRPSRANLLVDIDNVIFAKMQSTKKNLLIDDKTRELIVSTGYYVLEPKQDKILPKYLFFIVESNFFQNQKDKFCVGATQKALNNEGLKNLKIPLPSLSIQQKIVERLDAIRKAQELNEKQISLANELFQILLYRELKPKKNWKVKRFQEISNPQYGYTASAEEEGKYRFIRITDIGENGELRNTDKKYISASRKTIEPYILKKGDLLLARTGATFGKILYFDNKEPAVFASYLIKINPKKLIVLPQYIWLFSRSKYYWRQAKLLRTGSGQPQFNANKLKRVKISLPPIKVQCQIVKKLSAILDYKKKLLRQKELLKELFESTLEKAMKGELAK